MSAVDSSDSAPLLCDRCLAELHPGRGDWYLVRIEAFADPSPPVITDEDLARDHAAEIDELLRRMSEMSERELLDQVHRRLSLSLCGPCYRAWIENPTG